MIAFEALRSGEIDLYPEYTGTGYSTILKNKLRPGFTPDEMYTLVKQQMRTRIRSSCWKASVLTILTF